MVASCRVGSSSGLGVPPRSTLRLPCANCRVHYSSYLKNHPPDSALLSRSALSRYIYDLHESVNKRLGKEGMAWNKVKENYGEEEARLANKGQSPCWSCAKKGYLALGLSVAAFMGITLYLRWCRQQKKSKKKLWTVLMGYLKNGKQ